MDIYLRTGKLQSLRSQAEEARRRLGPEMGRKLQQRMIELKAAECLVDMTRLPSARCHELSDERLSVDLKHPYRLIFVPANEPIPRKEDGGLDWTGITAVEITDIADTHDGKIKR